MTSASYIGIGEYSAKKIYFFPGLRKNIEKISPYFHFQKWKIVRKLHFFGKNSHDLHYFGKKLQKFANLGVEIEKNAPFRIKIIKICTF